MRRRKPNFYELRKLLLRLPLLAQIPEPGSFRSRIRERLLKMGYSSLDGYFSQGGQDRFVDEILLDGLRNGTFVEIGANDGLTLSNCLYFERSRSWRGICVEPNPIAFEKLRKNRAAVCIQACIGDREGDVEFPVIADGEQSLFARRGGSGDSQSVVVRQTTIPKLFEEQGLSEVTFLSIDTEGGELDSILQLAETSIRPRIIAIEENTSPEQMDNAMRGLGYRLEAKVWPDRIYSR